MNTDLYAAEIARIDQLGATKRYEKIISGFTGHKAQISGESYLVFNSNDYLGLRFSTQVISAEHRGSRKFGAGPGAVRFISGTLQVHRDLEKSLAIFHGRDDAIVFSSAFAANLAVISALVKGASKDSLINSDVLVISDELNHRSIIDGVRLANLPESQRLVYRHLDVSHLSELLAENSPKFSRILVITDGVFSMLGEIAPLSEIRAILPNHATLYVDDCHGIGVLGQTGRGIEEITNSRADILVGTLGKAFGTDGGYVVADKTIISYLRESAATYIYSNSITPGTASAAIQAIQLASKKLKKLQQNIALFKKISGISNNSIHAIQPLIVGDPQQSLALRDFLFSKKILVSSINYPIVPKSRDEIRLQLSAAHTTTDIKYLVDCIHAFS